MAKTESKKTIYYFGIFLVILIWGIIPNITQYSLRFYSPAIWNAITSLIAVLAMLVICGKKLKNLSWDYCKVAIPTGLFYSLACIAQKTGLTMTTPAQYAFLENTSCIFVPILMFLFVRQKITFWKILSGGLCLVGVFILCGGDLQQGVQFGPGEILCGLAGIFYSVNIAGTAAFAKKLDAALYLLVQFAVQCVLSFIYSFVAAEELRFSFQIGHILLLVAIVLISHVLGWLLRVVCLKHLDASFVAVITPFSSVITGVMSVILGTDILSTALIVGSVIIFAAILISGLADARPNKQNSRKMIT